MPDSSNRTKRMLTFVDLERHPRRDCGPTSSRLDLSRTPSTTSTITNNGPESSRPSSVFDMSATEKRGSRSSSLRPLTRRVQRGTHGYLNQELALPYMGGPVLVCFFVSGLVDSVTFNTFNCFAHMQTGNTVFAALGISGQPKASHERQSVKCITAILAFIAGTIFFSSLHRSPTSYHLQPSSRPRWLFSLSFFLQTLFIILAAALAQTNLVSNLPYISGAFSSGADKNAHGDESMHAYIRDTLNYLDLLPIGSLAFGAAGQVTFSRVLGLLELPTIVLSALYHDFVADLLNLRQSWRERTSLKDYILIDQRRQLKRGLCIVAHILGAIVGGGLYRSAIGMAGALWLAAGIKFALAVMWMMWPAERVQEVDEEAGDRRV